MKLTLNDTIELILSQPTAPFRETWVKSAVEFYCGLNQLPTFTDNYGNLWVNASNARDVKNSELVFVAHMDHPGMVIERFYKKGRKFFADAKWLGGGPKDLRGFPVQVFSEINSLCVFNGVIRSHTSGSHGADKVVIEILADKIASYGKASLPAICHDGGMKAFGPWGACLWFEREGAPQGVTLKKFGKETKWVTKAADDLVGVCALLHAMTAKRASPNIKRKKITLLLSRAEESGFHGTLAVLDRKMLDPKRTHMISIEASSRLPAALPGLGPIVRLGDRMSVFNPAFVHWMTSKASALAKSDKKFTYQRRIMDAGSCEATAFTAFGYRAAGISCPLENYHNQFLPVELLLGKKLNMKSRNKPHPEMVAASDVEKMAKLIAMLMSEFDAKNIAHSHAPLRAKLMKHSKEESRKYA